MSAVGRLSVFAVVVALLGASTSTARAENDETNEPKRKGHPTVVLDRLEIPNVPGAQGYKRHLRQVLRRETYRADWGVGAGHRIEYRFLIDKLSIIRRGSVLRVNCIAVGRLPKGKTAKSKLAYGGDPTHVHRTVKNVLEIVARGVITRLAELERVRRGQLRQSGIRPLAPAE